MQELKDSEVQVHGFSISNKDLSVIKYPVLLGLSSNKFFFIGESQELYLNNKPSIPIMHYKIIN